MVYLTTSLGKSFYLNKEIRDIFVKYMKLVGAAILFN